MFRDPETATGKQDAPIEFVDSDERRFVLEATRVCEYRRCRSRWTVVREFPYESLIPEFSALRAPSTNFMTGLVVIAGGIAIAAFLRPFSRPSTPVGELLAAAVICFWVSGFLPLLVGRRRWT